LGYYNNYLVDNPSCVIVGVQATAARMSQETVAAQDMLARFAQWQGREPESVAADTTYGNGEFLQWLADRNVTAYMRTRDSALRKNNPGYGPERFTYQPASNTYRCPAGEQLNYVGLNVRNRAHAYIGSAKRCGACSQKTQCTTGRYKYLAIHMHESVRQRARELAQTPEFSSSLVKGILTSMTARLPPARGTYTDSTSKAAIVLDRRRADISAIFSALRGVTRTRSIRPPGPNGDT
jgi:hypothetical protein